MDSGKIDIASLNRALKLGFCIQCLSLLAEPKNELILLNDDHDISSRFQTTVRSLLSSENEALSEESAQLMLESNKYNLCPCCFGSISGNAIRTMIESVKAFLTTITMHTNAVNLTVIIPPIIDTMRLTARTVITRNTNKLFPFPNLGDVLSRLLKTSLSEVVNVVDPRDARYELIVSANVTGQLQYCTRMDRLFKPKKLKRKFGFGAPQPSAEPEQEEGEDYLSRGSTDALLMSYKSMGSAGFDTLTASLKAHVASLDPLASVVTWAYSCKTCPLYLFGRYRKLARDVPQAPWTISVNVSGKGEEDDGDREAPENLETAENKSSSGGSGALQQQRKGRNSVEEIVAHSVATTLRASDCRMHPCGREDIDVRCLGNGRPFALEVNNAQELPSQERLDEVVREVNARQGINCEGDIELFRLTLSDRGLWEGMQEKAEEKKKGYTCVVWSADKIDRNKLNELEELCRSGVNRDEEGVSCIEISQKTPLRVLHRRSLLARKRYVYNLETALLNDHFFLLRLVTSAGTYVKEFVHGDLGRTVPNVASFINCQTDILQLDVTWLFDDFPGGGEDFSQGNYTPASMHCGPPRQVAAAEELTVKCSEAEGVSAIDSVLPVKKWHDMQRMRLPKYAGAADTKSAEREQRQEMMIPVEE